MVRREAGSTITHSAFVDTMVTRRALRSTSAVIKESPWPPPSSTFRVSSEYAEIARRPLSPEQCALVVIDIQEKLLPPIFQKDQLVRNAQLLIRAASILKIPALASTQYAKGLGGTVSEVASLLPGTEPIDKTLFSCFGSDAFCTCSNACRDSAPRCCFAAWKATSASLRRP